MKKMLLRSEWDDLSCQCRCQVCPVHDECDTHCRIKRLLDSVFGELYNIAYFLVGVFLAAVFYAFIY